MSSKPKKARKRAPVMFDPLWHSRLKVVAAHRGLSIEDAARKYLGRAIDREYRKVCEEVERGAGGK